MARRCHVAERGWRAAPRFRGAAGEVRAKGLNLAGFQPNRSHQGDGRIRLRLGPTSVQSSPRRSRMARKWYAVVLSALVVTLWIGGSSGQGQGGGTSPLLCGDVNGDGAFNVADAVYTINYVFRG